MKVSVLMPTYGTPPLFLERAIASVAMQTHQDFEIVIKDGCIEHPAIADPTIAEWFRMLGDRVKYTVSPDGPPPEQSGAFKHNGFYEALNHCIKEATGEILCLLCADDERGPADTLAFVDRQFEQHGPAPFFLYGACERIDKNNSLITVKTPPTVTFQSLLCDYELFTPSLFWNRAVHDRFGLFDENLAWCADVDFWLRCWRGMDTQRTDRVIGKYRAWETSQAAANLPLLWQESSAIQKRYRS